MRTSAKPAASSPVNSQCPGQFGDVPPAWEAALMELYAAAAWPRA